MEHIFAIGLGIWSALLTAFVGVIGFIAREKNTKLKDLEQMLINTKLEVARDNVTIRYLFCFTITSTTHFTRTVLIYQF